MSNAATKKSIGFRACSGPELSRSKEHQRWITRSTNGRLVVDRMHAQLLRCIAKVDELPLAQDEEAARAALEATLDTVPEGL